MRYSSRKTLLALIALAALGACSRTSASDDGVANHPATVERIAGSEGARVTLTDQATKRIGLETAVVKDAPGGLVARLTMPNAAVLYDPTGRTWAYVSFAGGSYVRTPITVDHVSGSDAFLSEGPPSGSNVVTTGAQELYGAESTFGES